MSAAARAHRSTRACPVCDGHASTEIHQRRFVLPDGHPLDAPYVIVCCDACGMVFADTALPQAAYDAYYAQGAKYADQQTGTGAGDAPWDDARLRETAATIGRYLPARDWRVVDVGCAGGGLLRWLARDGHQRLDGVDPSPACARTVSAIAGVHGHVGSLLDLPPSVLGADAAVLSHVMEHVRDVDRAMQALRSLVRVGGRLYVEVPDATRYAEFLVAPFQDFNVEHINHFSLASLGNLLSRYGFRVLDVGQKTIAASADVPYPAVWAVAEREAAGAGSLWRASPDATLRTAMERYVRASRDRLGAFDARIAEILRDVPELIVWGTGQTTRELLAETALGKARVVAFADSNTLYHGRQLAGAPVVAPEQLRAYSQPILVGSVVSQAAIVERAAALGLRDRLLLLDPSLTHA
jgi:SAM-dependent methyltransferase